MAREAELPDGTVLEFPDDTPDAVIDRAVRSHLGGAKPAPQSQTFEQKVAAQRAADAKQYDPTRGMGTLDRLRAGFGKAFVDTAEGIGQGVAETVQRTTGMAHAGLRGLGLDGAAGVVAQHVGLPAYQAMQQADANVAARRDRDAQLMDTGAGMVGNVAGQVAQAAIPVGGAARGATIGAKLGNAAAHGAMYAGAQPVVGNESRLANAGTGAVLSVGGQGLASGLGRVASSAANRLGEPVRQSIELARRAGIPLHVSQVTDSLPIKAAAAAAKWLPFSGAGGAAAKQQQAFNAAVGRSFGADATTLTDDVMKGARQKIGRVFEDVYNRNDVPLAPADLRKLVALETNAAKNLTNDEAQVLRNQLDRILDNADNGVLTGKKYQAVRTAMQAAERDGGKVSSAVKALRKELDDIAAKAVGPEDAARLAKSRGQWANMRTVEDSLKQVGGAAGNVRPSSLWPLIRNGSTKEMRELARIGQVVLKDGLGDTGTAQRSFWMNALTGGGGAAIGSGAVASGLLLPLLKGAAVGAAAGRTLNSNAASKALQAGRPTGALARMVQGATPYLPIAAPATVRASDGKKKRP